MNTMKTIMIDMDEVIVNGRFTEFLDEFLDGVDFEKLNGHFRQSLIKGREEEFKKIYQFKNLYKKEDGSFIAPMPDCVETIKKLNEHYEIYIVTAYVWKENVIDAAHNLKYKYEYLKHFFPFIDTNNFIFISDKSKIKFDIGIDDRTTNLINCEKKLLFTEFRNEKISKEELEKNNIIRVNDWLEIEKILI
ncbi:MAG: hypothetical protein J6A89_06930 [Clostridia bacterium]|nr:hypothetical protein [Clostridia bacterium]